MKWIASHLFVLTFLSCAYPATITVDLNGGLDFPDIQPAIDTAKDGDTVFVMPGEYVIMEPINFNRLHDPDDPASPTIKNITLRGEAGPDQTTIRMAELPTDEDRASVVIFVNGESSASVLEGFTLTGGRGSLQDGFPGNHGGGVFCIRESSPTLKDCTISGNTASSGGGLYSWWCDPTIIDCKFYKNSAGSGGGIYSWRSDTTIVRCVLGANSAFDGGGVFSTEAGSLTMKDCLLSGNVAENDGGGFHGSWSFSSDLIGCTFHGNVAGDMGGAICCSIENKVALANSILWGNKGAHGSEIAVQDESHYTAMVAVSFCIIQGGAEGIRFGSDRKPDWRVGNITVDPAFIAPGHWDDAGTPEDPSDDRWIEGDYHLRPESPAVDEGTLEGASISDIEGRGRPCGEGVDIGAYEYCGPSETQFKRGDVDGNRELELTDVIKALNYQFLGGVDLECFDAADIDDDGEISITDAIRSLSFQFVGEVDQVPEPPGPFTCGPDVNDDTFPPCDYPPESCK